MTPALICKKPFFSTGLGCSRKLFIRIQAKHYIDLKNIYIYISVKLLGIWLIDTLDWELNTMGICKKVCVRISLLTKLKYVGMKMEDLLTVYKTFIRCTVEYCCVVCRDVNVFIFLKTIVSKRWLSFAIVNEERRRGEPDLKTIVTYD